MCVPLTLHDVVTQNGLSGQNFSAIKIRLAAKCDDGGSHHSAYIPIATVVFEETDAAWIHEMTDCNEISENVFGVRYGVQ